jgi:hypothetical protein
MSMSSSQDHPGRKATDRIQRPRSGHDEDELGDNEEIRLTDDFDLTTEISSVDMNVPYGELTAKLDTLTNIAKLKRQTEEPETLGDTSLIKVYPFAKPRIGVKKLLLDRFEKK